MVSQDLKLGGLLTSHANKTHTETFENGLNIFKLETPASSTCKPINRMRPKHPPKYMRHPENWSGLDDYAKEYRKNGMFLNLIAITLGSVHVSLQSSIHEEFQAQSDVFEETTKEPFQHILEVKLLYIGGGPGIIGIGPGIWCGGLFITAGIIGLLEYWASKCCPKEKYTRRVLRFPKIVRQNWYRIFYIFSLSSLLAVFPVIINHSVAIYHKEYVPHRERSGYCTMNEKQTDYRYIMPVNRRNCPYITDLHSLEIAFCLLQLMISATLLRVAHEPAWYDSWYDEY